jgi:tRNA(Met) C34 N-acetyltransferase TmcA
MIKRLWYLQPVLCALVITTVIGSPRTVLAELGVGIGDLAGPTSQASATLNEAIAAFHHMLADLDRKDVGRAAADRKEALTQLQHAGELYKIAMSQAGKRILEPRPHSEQERKDVEYFTQHAADYQLKPPVSQIDLLGAVERLIFEFTMRLDKLDLAKTVKDIRAQQAILIYMNNLELFLSSTTTMLTLG